MGSIFQLFDPDAELRVTTGANLPHWYQPGATYFVTFRTDDSIPADVSRRWYAERAQWLEHHGIATSSLEWRAAFDALPREQRQQFHETFSRQYLENLDKGWGACVFRNPEFSEIVANSLLHFDSDRYHMADFVVMPNHVHLLVGLLGDTDILDQCYSWKKFTAGKINKLLGTSGRFWQEESFDHLVRSPAQFEAIRQYIQSNPMHLPHGQYHLYDPK